MGGVNEQLIHSDPRAAEVALLKGDERWEGDEGAGAGCLARRRPDLGLARLPGLVQRLTGQCLPGNKGRGWPIKSRPTWSGRRVHKVPTPGPALTLDQADDALRAFFRGAGLLQRTQKSGWRRTSRWRASVAGKCGEMSLPLGVWYPGVAARLPKSAIWTFLGVTSLALRLWL